LAQVQLKSLTAGVRALLQFCLWQLERFL